MQAGAYLIGLEPHGFQAEISETGLVKQLMCSWYLLLKQGRGGCEAETNQIMLGSDCLSKGKEATKADGLIPSQHFENLRGLALF